MGRGGSGPQGSTGVGRRAFLGGAAASAAALAWTRVHALSASVLPGVVVPQDPFTLGVASGDPTPDAVIIWTRLAPDPIDVAAMPAVDVAVRWEVATDAGFGDVVAAGTAIAAPELAHSVKVDVGGLDPDAWYFYRFSASGYDSPVGRTRTLPASDCTAGECRFAIGSCQSWTNGYYPAHDFLAAEDLDLVFWLGDYIYEGGVGSGVRPHNSSEVFTLDDYRNRYGLYKSDPSLQASHAAFPWVTIWDDHEVDNNYAGQFDENGTDPATFLTRRAAAYRAWWEHQPVRVGPPVGPDLLLHRGFSWGEIIDFYALDTRQYRSAVACGGSIAGDCSERTATDRTMLGDAQEAWLFDGLRSSQAIWNVMANSVVMTSLPLFTFWNMDQWDGYAASQQRLMDVLAEPEVRNPVTLTGDIHMSGFGELTAGPDAPRVGTEIVGTSISSNFPATYLDVIEPVLDAIEWVHYAEAHLRGYVALSITPERMEANYRFVESVATPTSTLTTNATFVVESGVTGVAACEITNSPAPAGDGQAAASPTAPPSRPASAAATTPSFTG